MREWLTRFHYWTSENPGTLADWAMVLVTFVAALAALRTLKIIGRQTRAAENAATAAKTNAGAVLLAERAYISISHRPPGIAIDAPATAPGEEEFVGWHPVYFRFVIANNGNTPARVTDICMYHVVDPPSSAPPIPTGPGSRERLFLVKGDSFEDSRTFQVRHA